MDPEIYEKSGYFYLGREWNSKSQERTDEPLLYDSRDLTTHAVCVGMTGSGKTGLGIGVLEEAALEGIPAIIIDPKGDMGNLLLTFPALDAESFGPWVSHDEAARRGVSKDELAESVSKQWKKGLASWGQGGERIRRLRETVDIGLYTPGSTAGRPLALLKSLHAPSKELRQDDDLYRERVADTISGLLELAGVKADPVTSREHILLTTILRTAWDRGEDMSLETLVGRIPDPGIQRVGAFALDAFFPSKDRFALAMQLNNLLASPSFAAWSQGDPLDIDALLWTPDGKPRLSILNIAHLSDAERMFLVTSVLGELISWMRRQRGTENLRALFYMDEVFGYLPPTAQPPSKRGLMTLLKQARAFGLGLMLCTQNPADIDYKALSNAGTWFVGRLQTPQDRDRLLKGMASSMDAGGHAMDRATLSDLISNLGQRRFVMQNVHKGYPVLFETRWVMSYMAGPLSRPQILELVEQQAFVTASSTASTASTASSGSASTHGFDDVEGEPTASRTGAESHNIPEGFVREKPALAPAFEESYMPVGEVAKPGDTLLWRPMIIGCGNGVIDRKRPPVQATLSLSRIAFVEDRPVPLDWAAADDSPFDERALVTQRPTDGVWELPAPALNDPKRLTGWRRDLIDYWSANVGVESYRAGALKLQSEEGESEAAFRERVRRGAQAQYEMDVQKIEVRINKRLVTINERIQRYELTAESRRADARSRQMDSVVRGVGSLFGGRRGGMTTSMNRSRMASRSRAAATRADAQRDAAIEQRQLLEQEYTQALSQAEEQRDRAMSDVETRMITPPRTGIRIRYFGLVWVPYYAELSGRWRRAWVVPAST